MSRSLYVCKPLQVNTGFAVWCFTPARKSFPFPPTCTAYPSAGFGRPDEASAITVRIIFPRMAFAIAVCFTGTHGAIAVLLRRSHSSPESAVISLAGFEPSVDFGAPESVVTQIAVLGCPRGSKAGTGHARTVQPVHVLWTPLKGWHSFRIRISQKSMQFTIKSEVARKSHILNRFR